MHLFYVCVQMEPVGSDHIWVLLSPANSLVLLPLVPSPCNNENKMGYASTQMVWQEKEWLSSSIQTCRAYFGQWPKFCQ